MKTQGEMEAAICEGIGRFEQHYTGRGPKSVHAHLIGAHILVLLQDVLTGPEQQLIRSTAALGSRGQELVKQMRAHLVEAARPQIEAVVAEATGVQVRSMHHDISPITSEEILVFTLTEPPQCREVRRR